MNIKRMLATLAFLTFVVGSLSGAYAMHASANADYVPATWKQSVVTVDDFAYLTNEWVTEGVPFIVREAAPGETADITFDVKNFGDMTGGEATRIVEGDTIVSCHIDLDGNRGVDFMAIRHELGHCFGLSHDNGHDDSLMYWVQGGDLGSQHVTDRDRANLADLYAN